MLVFCDRLPLTSLYIVRNFTDFGTRFSELANNKKSRRCDKDGDSPDSFSFAFR